MYTLVFGNDETGKKRYEICTQALLLTSRAPQLDEQGAVISVLRKLKSIGDRAQILENGTQLYDLREDEVLTIALDRDERKIMLLYINQPIWKPNVLEAVHDTRDWLDDLKFEKPELV